MTEVLQSIIAVSMLGGIGLFMLVNIIFREIDRTMKAKKRKLHKSLCKSCQETHRLTTELID